MSFTSPTEQMLEALYTAYGYSCFTMSKFEEYALYAENKNFLLSDNMITFTDTTGRLMALKPDVTLAIVKNTADEPQTRKKLQYTESVYRVSQKSGTFREIEQAGVECLGDIDGTTLAEILTLAEKSLFVISPDSLLAVSDLDMMDYAVKCLGVPPSREGAILDCVGEKNRHGIDEILKEEGLPLENAAFLKGLLAAYGSPKEILPTLCALAKEYAAEALYDRFAAVIAAIDASRVVIDFSILGDLRYYSGIVFRGYVNGIAEDVLSGGEYNRLMQKMKKTSKAVGFAVYLDLVDDFARSLPDYEFDCLVLYDENQPITAVLTAAEGLRESGLSVLVEKSLPADKRCRKVYRLKEGVLCETNA